MSGITSGNTNCEEDVLRIKKKLEKMMKSNDIDAGLSIDMLNTIKKLPIDLQILKSTGIGVVLNNLRRSCNSEELGTLAKNLLKNWKKLVANETQQNTNGSSPNSNSNDSASKQPVSPPPTSNGNSTVVVAPSPAAAKLNFSNTIGSNGSATNGNGKRPHEAIETSNKPPVEAVKARYNPHFKRNISYTETKDPVRLKCREMLAQALELTESIENGAELCDHLQVAARCEDVIFNEFKNVDQKYKNRIRSRVINLKDARNPKLRENVRLGLITPEKLATMTAEDMASDDLKNLRAKFTQEAIDDHQMARTQGAKTSQLTCGKCKKNNVAYSEMQTRSADEPMTTFAYCQECGHRWKFG